MSIRVVAPFFVFVRWFVGVTRRVASHRKQLVIVWNHILRHDLHFVDLVKLLCGFWSLGAAFGIKVVTEFAHDCNKLAGILCFKCSTGTPTFAELPFPASRSYHHRCRTRRIREGIKTEAAVTALTLLVHKTQFRRADQQVPSSHLFVPLSFRQDISLPECVIVLV